MTDTLTNNSKTPTELRAMLEDLHDIISEMKSVLAIAIVSRTVAFVFVPTGWVYAHKLAVFSFDSTSYFAILQSNFHYHWAWQYSSTMKLDLNYSPSDCFGTFPFPEINNNLENIGQEYYDHRQSIMKTRQEGLTATYNRFHNEDETAPDIQKLRELHIKMDNAVAQAYGWTDLNLEHGFHKTKQGIRFTISEPARREVLDRLLQLNHERYAEEVAQGLHDKGKKKKTTRAKKSQKTKNTKQKALFPD